MAGVFKRRGRWVADFRDRNRTRHWISKRTKREAEAELQEALRQIGEGTYTSKHEAVCFEELAESFLESKKATVRESTMRDYLGINQRHLLPAFTGWRVRDITLARMEKFRSDLLDKLRREEIDRITKLNISDGEKRERIGRAAQRGTRTVNKALTQLTMMFNHALRHRWLTHNPASLTKKLRQAQPPEALIESNILAPGEIRRLLDACSGSVRPVVMTAIYTGLRQGELLGLKWGDIELDTGKLYVRQQWTSGKFVEPKTRAGRRKVDLPPTLVAELRRWKLQCPKGELDLVFPNGAGKPENPQNLLRRGFYPALRRAKLRKIRFPDLRHTFASLMIHNNEPITRVSTALGHWSPAVTLNVYAHLIPSDDTSAAHRLDELIGFSKSGSKVSKDSATSNASA